MQMRGVKFIIVNILLVPFLYGNEAAAEGEGYGVTPEMLEQMKNYKGPSEQDMQAMQQALEAADELQECFNEANIEESYYEKLAGENEKIEQKIMALCEAGDWKKATSEAKEYTKRIYNDPVLKKLHECSQKVAAQMPKHMQNETTHVSDYVYDGKNICAETDLEETHQH